jgi:SAM-dependent methyltransferase
MQYDPIKKTLGRFFSGPAFMRKLFYFLLDLLLLRTWHVKKALRKISPCYPEDAYVLDAGSGFGQYSWRMKRLNRGWNITAVDIDKERVDESASFFKKAGLEDMTCQVGDLVKLSVTDLYNIILSVDVMEHIKEDTQVFGNFYRALRENGVLLISTPSDKGGSDVRKENDHSFIDEHVRDGYGTEEITSKLSNAGFKNVTASYTYGTPGSISWRLTMKYPVKLLGVSKLFFLLLPFYYIVVFPFALILNQMDVSTNHKSGTGLLVTAYK